MIKYRDHRGSLAESMKTVQEFKTKTDLIKYLRDSLPVQFRDCYLKIKYYSLDNRINWNTHIVTVEGLGVVGFTDGDFKNGN